MRPHPKPIRFVNQQIDPLAPFKNPLDIFRHDALDRVNVLLHIGDGVGFAGLRGAVFNHEGFQGGVEVGSAIGRHCREVCPFRIVLGQESFLDFYQEPKRYAAADTGVGDD